MDWQGKKNGELLGLMTLDGFDALVTMDKSLPSQQNLGKFPIAIFILRGLNNKFETLQVLVPLILHRIEQGVDSGVIEIAE